MRFSLTTLVLATVAIGQTLAIPFAHVHSHARNAEPQDAEAPAEKRDGLGSYVSNALTTADSIKLLSLGLLSTGINALSQAGGVWIGTDGPYTNTFYNEAGQNIILVIWGPAASWINVQQPLITVSLPAGAQTMISFASGSIGAWSAIYPDTTLVNGQISNTWGEHTFSPAGVVDVSREPNMSGHPMTIVGPQCTSNMNTCVFVCSSGNVCMTDYQLLNCSPGSQPGAQYGTYSGAPSGGCGGLGNSANLQTYFS